MEQPKTPNKTKFFSFEFFIGLFITEFIYIISTPTTSAQIILDTQAVYISLPNERYTSLGNVLITIYERYGLYSVFAGIQFVMIRGFFYQVVLIYLMPILRNHGKVETESNFPLKLIKEILAAVIAESIILLLSYPADILYLCSLTDSAIGKFGNEWKYISLIWEKHGFLGFYHAVEIEWQYYIFMQIGAVATDLMIRKALRDTKIGNRSFLVITTFVFGTIFYDNYRHNKFELTVFKDRLVPKFKSSRASGALGTVIEGLLNLLRNSFASLSSRKNKSAKDKDDNSNQDAKKDN
jgi:hypothetical protein